VVLGEGRCIPKAPEAFVGFVIVAYAAIQGIPPAGFRLGGRNDEGGGWLTVTGDE